MLASFKQLIRLRRDAPVLRRASIDAPAFVDEEVIVLVQQLGGQITITATNNGERLCSVRLRLPTAVPGGTLRDALTGAQIDAATSDGVFTVPPLWGTVLISPGAVNEPKP